MIAIDTSALLAIAQNEPLGPACLAAIEVDGEVVISAATLAEALVVTADRDLQLAITSLVDSLSLEVQELTPAAARRVGDVYRRWGKGIHPAGLNFGDCFAYELAERFGCPLLYIGNDFGKTDIESAI